MKYEIELTDKEYDILDGFLTAIYVNTECKIFKNAILRKKKEEKTNKLEISK